MTKETAMKILKELHDKSLFAERTAIETIIPELNEDEKIRNALIRFHKSTIDVDGIKGEEIIAWLEKQGEQKPILDFKASNWYVSKVDGKIHDMTYNPTDKVEPKFKVKYAGSEYNVFETKNIAGVPFYGIEDEPNHIDYVQADNCEIISGYAIKENGSSYPTNPAVFSEQKPFDYEKATITQKDFAPEQEPKFKVGDWVRLMTLDEIRNTEGVVCERNERGEDMFLNRNYHAKVWIHFGEWLLPYLGKSFVIEKILGDCVEVPHNICYLQDWLFVKVE